MDKSDNADQNYITIFHSATGYSIIINLITYNNLINENCQNSKQLGKALKYALHSFPAMVVLSDQLDKNLVINLLPTKSVKYFPYLLHMRCVLHIILLAFHLYLCF